MNRTYALLSSSALAIALASCGDRSVSKKTGLDEPFLVEGGQFFEGPLLPGSSQFQVYSSGFSSTIIEQGQAGLKLSGYAQKGAYAVAFRFPDMGTGYWVVPVKSVNQDIAAMDYSWDTALDFAHDVAPGKHKMQLLAVSGDGTFGPLSTDDDSLTIAPLQPDGDVVISLEWDTDADLDLHVTGPMENNPEELYAKHPTSSQPEPDAGPTSPLPTNTGVLDRDSIASCAKDGYRREDAIWNWRPVGVKDPPQNGLPLDGTYQLRVDMFDACGQAAANFKVTVFVGGNSVFERVGRLLNIDADGGGAGSGLFVGEIVFAF